MIPNSQQLLVIEHFDGPCLVLAVPGSGKTASVTERTKRLIERGIDPKTILAITFTNKAADEMRQRIAKSVGVEKSSQMTISTFHSFCSRVIRANCNFLGLNKRYSIYDQDDQKRLLKTCIKKIESSTFKPSQKYMNSLMGFIEGKRNACLNDQEATEKFELDGNQFKVAEEYFNQLKKSNAVDFTGLLSETLKVLKEHPEIRDVYRQRFKYISVDEVQDTNMAQYELIKELGLGHRNVLVVGDLDQSIFKFRDANPENILQFEKDFSPCKVLKLEKNYRSTPSILKFSQNLIENNILRKGTELVTDNPDGSTPKIIAGETDLEMAQKISEEVARKIATGIKPVEIAILYRTNYASRVLENAMRNASIKYQIIGGLSFFDRKEIKAGLSILKLIANGNDRMAFENSCEACCKGIGEKSFSIIAEISQSKNITVMDAAKEFSINKPVVLNSFLTTFNLASPISPGESLLKIAQGTAFWDRLEKDSTDTNDRCANIVEMARDVDEYCSKPKHSLNGYLNNIALLSDTDKKDEDGMIKLMTLHACKGLEFDFVCISHCNEGLLPHAKSLSDNQAIEEERRLLYVGMTRARKHLSLYFAASKTEARSDDVKIMFPSPFLIETGIVSEDLETYRFGPDRRKTV